MSLYSLLIILYFLMPIAIALIPGLLREDTYGEPINDTISLVCLFSGSIVLGILFSAWGMDTVLASIARLLIISLLFASTTTRRELLIYLQSSAHVVPIKNRREKESHP